MRDKVSRPGANLFSDTDTNLCQPERCLLQAKGSWDAWVYVCLCDNWLWHWTETIMPAWFPLWVFHAFHYLFSHIYSSRCQKHPVPPPSITTKDPHILHVNHLWGWCRIAFGWWMAAQLPIKLDGYCHHLLGLKYLYRNHYGLFISGLCLLCVGERPAWTLTIWKDTIPHYLSTLNYCGLLCCTISFYFTTRKIELAN